MQFTVCENTGFYLRLALVGPSGAGKSWTALQIATELFPERDVKIGVIDTENKSARRYAKAFRVPFFSLELAHFSPRDYVEAIRQAEAAGIEVLIIDSLSHAWMGRGGVLEMVDQSARRQARGGTPSSFSGWREVTPEHNKLVDALVHAKLHLIVTMRTKTEYVVEKDDKGKSVPRKVGLAPVQRDGLEFEMDIVADMSPEHDFCISKSRCPALADAVINRPGPALAQTIRTWLDGAIREPEYTTGDQPPGTILRSGQPPQRPLPNGGTPQPGLPDDLRAIQPWLKRIGEAGEAGNQQALEAIRQELNQALPSGKRTRSQGEVLRGAIETAKAAIAALRARPDAAEQGPPEEEGPTVDREEPPAAAGRLPSHDELVTMTHRERQDAYEPLR